MKIGTLLPSATEIACVLGLEKYLVGVSHECDFPASIQGLPKLTSSSIGSHKSSGEIHRSVEALLKDSLSVYDLDLELLRSLKPDYLITQDLCDVCAVSFRQVEEACHEVLGTETKIISLRPQKLDDIWEDVSRVAQELDATLAFESFKQDVDQRIKNIQNKIAKNSPSKKSVLTIEWFDPVMIGGLWVPEMINIACGTGLYANAGEPAQTVSREDLSKITPDIVIIKPCGFKLDQTMSELDTLKKNVLLENWNANREGNIYAIDGNAYFNRPGPRIMDSLEILSYCMHPELFPEFYDNYHQAIIKLEPNFNIS